VQDLRDTHGNERFALRIAFPNKDYKPNAQGEDEKDYKPNAQGEDEKDFQVSQEKVGLTETN
jgi:hypothetical protein